MEHFRDRSQLLNYVCAQNHDKREQRIINDGSVELLGGFSKIEPFGKPGWIIKFTTTYKKREFVTYLFVYERNMAIAEVFIPESWVLWKYWDGDNSENPLYQGDRPVEYLKLKKKALEGE